MVDAVMVGAVSALPLVVTTLYKGPIFEEDQPKVWTQMVALQAQARDHLQVIGLTLVVNEARGYAYLAQLPDREGEDAGQGPKRLVARQQLSRPQSLLLVLLRKMLAEFESSTAGGAYLTVSVNDMMETVRVFLSSYKHDARLVDDTRENLNAIRKMGFLVAVKGDPDTFAVRPILQEFVDAETLRDYSKRLDEYLRMFVDDGAGNGDEDGFVDDLIDDEAGEDVR